MTIISPDGRRTRLNTLRTAAQVIDLRRREWHRVDARPVQAGPDQIFRTEVEDALRQPLPPSAMRTALRALGELYRSAQATGNDDQAARAAAALRELVRR